MGGAGSNGEKDRVWHLGSGSAEAVGGAGSDKERGPAATVGGASTDKKLTLKCMCMSRGVSKYSEYLSWSCKALNV